MSEEYLINLRQKCLEYALEKNLSPDMLFQLANKYYNWIVKGTCFEDIEKNKQINS